MKGMRAVRGLPLLLSVLTLGACVEHRRPEAVSLRDSANVQIVENGPLDERPAFRVGPLVYRVGRAPGEYEWQSVTSGLLLSGGRAAIGDAGREQVVELSARGATERAFGRKGNGPEEFMSLRVAGTIGLDTVVISDGGNTRVALYHDGRFVRSIPLGGIPGELSGVGIPRDGRLVMIPNGYAIRRGPGLPEWSPSEISALDLATGRAATIGRFDRAHNVVPGSPGGLVGNALAPFGHLAVTRGAIITNRADRAQIEMTEPTGRPIRLVRWDEPRRRLTDSVTDTYAGTLRRAGAKPTPDFERDLRALRADAPLRPYAGLGITGDDRGNVWLDEFSGGGSVTRYRVFGADGRWLGWVNMPPRFQVLDIAQGMLLGIQRDELDVQSIALYRVLPP